MGRVAAEGTTEKQRAVRAVPEASVRRGDGRRVVTPAEWLVERTARAMRAEGQVMAGMVAAEMGGLGRLVVAQEE